MPNRLVILMLDATIDGEVWSPEDGDELEDFSAPQSHYDSTIDGDQAKADEYTIARAKEYLVALTARFPNARILVQVSDNVRPEGTIFNCRCY